MPKKRLVTFGGGKERAFCSQLVLNIVRCAWRPGFEDPTFANAEKAISDIFNTGRSVSPSDIPYKLPLDFMYQLVRLLADSNELFADRPIFFLLDELENLTEAQWQVVNCF